MAFIILTACFSVSLFLVFCAVSLEPTAFHHHRGKVVVRRHGSWVILSVTLNTYRVFPLKKTKAINATYVRNSKQMKLDFAYSSTLESMNLEELVQNT